MMRTKKVRDKMRVMSGTSTFPNGNRKLVGQPTVKGGTQWSRR